MSKIVCADAEERNNRKIASAIAVGQHGTNRPNNLWKGFIYLSSFHHNHSCPECVFTSTVGCREEAEPVS